MSMANTHHAMWTPPLVRVGWIVLACMAMFFGLASALLPAWIVFSALLVPTVAILVLVRPEYGLTACIALVCGLVHPALVPRAPVFGGTLAAGDVTLVMLGIYALWIHATRDGNAAWLPVAGARRLATALGLFGVCFVVAVPLSLWYRDLNPTFVLAEARHLIYLMVLPIAVVILRRRARQERFVVSFVVLGCLFSIGQILQGVFNIPVFGDSGISQLETLGIQEHSTTRANTLGLNVIVFSLFLTVGAYVLGDIGKLLFISVAGLLSVGIILTFGRTTFAVVFVCVVMVVWWLNSRKLPELVALLLVLLAIGSATAIYWKPDSFAAVYYRMTSIGEEIDHGYSAQGRIWEAEAMLPQIQQHPLTGMGLGASYIKRSTLGQNSGLDRYVHNGYLYMAGKMGLPTLAIFMLSMAAIFSIGRHAAKSDASTWTRVVGAAGAAMMIRFLFASVTEPHLMSDYGVVVIAIAGALVYLGAQRANSQLVLGVADKARLPAAGARPSNAVRRR
jgi:O-antigen ligase